LLKGEVDTLAPDAILHVLLPIIFGAILILKVNLDPLFVRFAEED